MPRGNPSPKLANTARAPLQRRAGLAAVAEWEKQHGWFSKKEMVEARRNVGAQLGRSRTIRRPA